MPIDIRPAPTDFRTPISLVLVQARAVAKLVKLKHAMTSMISAMHPNNITWLMRPPVFFPFSNFPCRYNLENGYKKAPRLQSLQLALIIRLILASAVLKSEFGLIVTKACVAPLRQ